MAEAVEGEGGPPTGPEWTDRSPGEYAPAPGGDDSSEDAYPEALGDHSLRGATWPVRMVMPEVWTGR